MIPVAVRRLLEDVGAVLFPPVCHLCGCVLPQGERFICGTCVSELPRTGYHAHRMNPMEQRFAGLFPFTGATGHFFYARDSKLARLVHDFKYRHFPGLAVRLGEISGSELLASGFLSDVDLILPVPLHWRKQALRGYNQSERIAAGINRATGIPVGDNLRASRGHRTQTRLTPGQRRANTDGVFDIVRSEELDGKGILLVDDVCTTGATLTSSATALNIAVPTVSIRLMTIGVTL